jgi:hypothetical protein
MHAGNCSLEETALGAITLQKLQFVISTDFTACNSLLQESSGGATQLLMECQRPWTCCEQWCVQTQQWLQLSAKS